VKKKKINQKRRNKRGLWTNVEDGYQE